MSGASGIDEQQFKRRTKDVALRVIRLVESPPKNRTADISRAAIVAFRHFGGSELSRAACRGKPAADTIAKLTIVEEEADETLYWLDLIAEARLVPKTRLQKLVAEIDELVAMIVASQKTLRLNNPKSKIQNPK